MQDFINEAITTKDNCKDAIIKVLESYNKEFRQLAVETYNNYEICAQSHETGLEEELGKFSLTNVPERYSLALICDSSTTQCDSIGEILKLEKLSNKRQELQEELRTFGARITSVEDTVKQEKSYFKNE